MVASPPKPPAGAAEAEIDPVLLQSGLPVHGIVGDDASLAPPMERALVALSSTTLPRRLMLRRSADGVWLTGVQPDGARWTLVGKLTEARASPPTRRAEDATARAAAGENKTLVIRTGKSEKGRSFQGTLLAYADADALWTLGGANTEVHRPVWFVAACSEQEAGPFQANLRLGNMAEVPNGNRGTGRNSKGDRFELCRSARYQYAVQRLPAGTVIQAFLPELFAIDPGMVDPEAVRFVMVPAKTWLGDVSRRTRMHVKRTGNETDYPLGAAPLFCRLSRSKNASAAHPG